MTRQPSAAQRRAIRTADAESGLLQGPAAALASLVTQGLALRHPRPPHRHYLTPAGHRLRERLAAEPVRLVPPPEPDQAPDPAPNPARGPARDHARSPAPVRDSAAGDPPGVFRPRTAAGADRSSGESPPGPDPVREREVRSAWAGLIEMRRVTNPDHSVERPCDWERTHLTQAAALALEAGCCRGYLVSESAQPEAVRVDGPDAWAYAETLERAGWQTSAHADRRAGAPYLLASPRRV
ncbi:hypothetical protein [Streptomyces sp. NBC_01089]|uniref:hypothetical protein n=1 Tax=Streptomyces sp. NBC_01089 TaxID=2903747 RepID=UPI00386FBBE8|nr:hypothetical protein OG510_05150 [Streptomyces sp. NBC_01089]